MAAFTQNPFALLGDDNDGDAPAAPKPAPKAPAAAGGIPAASQRNVPGQQAPRRPKSDYPARGAPRGGFRGGEQRSAPTGGEEGFSSVNGRDDRAERTRGGARGGPRGQGRGGRGGPGARGGRGPRPDRHSQTGLHDSEKKEHQGWGGDEGKRELEAEVEGERDAEGEKKAGDGWDAAAPADGDKKADDGWGASKDGEAGAKEGKINGAPAPVEEEEDNTLTYDEYLAQQAAGVSIGGVESRSARQANAGADDSQWKNAVEVARKANVEEESYFASTKTKKQRERVEKVGKQVIEIDPHFAPPERRGGGERGGRGRGGERRGGNRGAGGRGRDFSGPPRGGRGGPRGQADVNPDDTNAFPSLS